MELPLGIVNPMICNIIDERKRRYRWLKVTAVAEATFHDNSVTDADQAAPDAEGVEYAEESGVSLAEAVAWANSLPGQVTLYIYDDGESMPSNAASPWQTA